jgi:hypothetical protein
MRLTPDDLTAILRQPGYRVVAGEVPPPAGLPPALAVVPDAPEGVLMETLRQLYTHRGYLWHHHYTSRRSSPGWPDIAAVLPAEAVPAGAASVLWLLEAKTATGAVAPWQQRWLAALARVTRVEARVVRPADVPDLLAALRPRRP